MTAATGNAESPWQLEPGWTFLNHGSFGACPTAVLARQAELRRRMELQPVRFFQRELQPQLDAARERLASFVGADARDLAFVPNATAGVNAVLRSLAIRPGDELLTTNHAYDACANALRYVADCTGAKVRVAAVPFPLRDRSQVTDAVLDAVGPRTRLVMLDHVTSPTGLVFPVADMVRVLEARGINVLVDGAHAPGMLPLDLDGLGASFYTGNLHKWTCAPKGSAFLHVRRDLHAQVRPTSISHGATANTARRSRFHAEFDWTGTADVTPWLCVPDALDHMGRLCTGGWPELMARNRGLALRARDILCSALAIERPAPNDMIGALAAVPLPDEAVELPFSRVGTHPIQDALYVDYIEVPIIRWPRFPSLLVRVSAQRYNEPRDYERLVTALRRLDVVRR
jgi:isopenicillin-N epimerase